MELLFQCDIRSSKQHGFLCMACAMPLWLLWCRECTLYNHYSNRYIFIMEAVVGGRICSWEHLSYTDSSELLQLSTANQTIANKLEEIFTLNTNSEEKIESKRAHITRDLFYHVVMFARRNNFKEEQLSALITIMKSVHELCISTPYDNSRDCYELMKQLLMCHSVHRPPYSIQLYSLDQVKTVMEYILQAYFKHFKLYKYAFTKRVLLDLKISYEGVEDTPPSSHTNLLTECEAGKDQ